jgi:hypothetical protein
MTAFLAINGNDATAMLNDATRPFKTLAAAQAALAPHRATTTVRIIDLGYVA